MISAERLPALGPGPGRLGVQHRQPSHDATHGTAMSDCREFRPVVPRGVNVGIYMVYMECLGILSPFSAPLNMFWTWLLSIWTPHAPHDPHVPPNRPCIRRFARPCTTWALQTHCIFPRPYLQLSDVLTLGVLAFTLSDFSWCVYAGPVNDCRNLRTWNPSLPRVVDLPTKHLQTW